MTEAPQPEGKSVDDGTPPPPPPAGPRNEWLRPSHTVPIATAIVAVAVVVWLITLTWTGSHPSPVAADLLQVQIMTGAVPVIVYALWALSVLPLLIRRPTRKRVLVAGIAVFVGAALAVFLLWKVGSDPTFGVYVGKSITVWTIAALAVIGLAISTFWKSGWLRKLSAAFAIVLAVCSATLGINSYFGLDPTIGDLAGISVQSNIHLPPLQRAPSSLSTNAPGLQDALWSTWKAPADMPLHGKVGSVKIPNTVSGFIARPAGVYLPPAALVANPPALPVVIMMMGQPGNPDPTLLVKQLDAFAARHNGLAPIVVVADQIGNPTVDTLCLNTARYGNVETYITRDVVGWVRTHLHVMQDPAHWTVAGYSNGGECAAYFGAKYPKIWGNVVDISGEAYPGSEAPQATLAHDFGGDMAAYQKVWPVTILGGRRYSDSWGVFTVSSDDLLFRLQVTAVSRAARGAGWKSTFVEIRDGGHGDIALTGGFEAGLTDLSARWGLSDPASGQ